MTKIDVIVRRFDVSVDKVADILEMDRFHYGDDTPPKLTAWINEAPENVIVARGIVDGVDELLGFAVPGIVYGVMEDTGEPEPVVNIRRMLVGNTLRRQKIASHLLTAIGNTALASKIDVIVTAVSEYDLDAQLFLRATGWNCSFIKKNAYPKVREGISLYFFSTTAHKLSQVCSQQEDATHGADTARSAASASQVS